MYSLAESETPQLPPPPAFGLIYEGAIGQQTYRRNLFVTPWYRGSPTTGRQYGSTVVMAWPDMHDFSVEGLLYSFTSCKQLATEPVLLYRASAGPLSSS
jgi:hypothetical protein